MSMWGTLDRLNSLAKENAQKALDKAKKVAADLEGQLDASVGVEGAAAASKVDSSAALQEDDNDAWSDDDLNLDDDLDATTDTTSAKSSPVATEDGPSHETEEALVKNDAVEIAANPEPQRIDVSELRDNDLHVTPNDEDEGTVDLDVVAEARPQLDDAEPVPPKAPEEPHKSAGDEDNLDAVIESNPDDTSDTESRNKDTDAPQKGEESHSTEELEQSAAMNPTEIPNEDVTEPDASNQTQPIPELNIVDAIQEGEMASEEKADVVSLVAPPEENGEIIPPQEEILTMAADQSVPTVDHAEVQKMQEQVLEMQRLLQQRENQLLKHTEQITAMQNLHESEKKELEQRIEQTKEEARRRLAKAKERVEAVEKRAAATSTSSSESVAEKDQIITELREEGQKLANKQMEMEKAVRAAKSEAREWREQAEEQEVAKEKGLERIAVLEADLKATKADLTAARKGESQASRLESDLQSAREDTEQKAAFILGLEQQVKELKASNKELNKELEAARKGAALDSEREQKKLKKEHTTMLEDLETKLRTTEKEAAVREDALRHEVSELRKRWQDAVRRADSLSMDVQSSTAPLMRQLESMERQNRTRAAGWAELENKLREELEEAILSSEKLQKERNELKTKHQRLERHSKDLQSDYFEMQAQHEEQTKKIESLTSKLAEMEESHASQKAEWDEVQRLANEGVTRVRSEMTQTMVETEERHVSQIDSLKTELRQEQEKRIQLEQQVQGLLGQATAMVLPPENGNAEPIALIQKAPPKKLSSATGQNDLLKEALSGFGDDSDNENENGDTDEEEFDANGGSFAALEELQSRLKVSRIELQALRKSLEDSEKTREKLVAELAESRHAKERLPLLEHKVDELTAENRALTLEISGLQDDIAEVRELYRSQLNVLLEEKAASSSDIPLPSDQESGEAERAANTEAENFEAMRLAKKD